MKMNLAPLAIIILLINAIVFINTGSVFCNSEDIQSRFEPWLWDKLQELEVESPDRYITLILRSPDHEAKAQLGKNLTRSSDVTDLRVLDALTVTIAKVRVSRIRELASSPLIKHIGDGEARVVACSGGNVAANVATIGANTTWATYGVNGSGITIAILDTGIDKTHPDLDDLDDDPNTDDPKVIANVSFVPGEDSEDYEGHGTSCAGLAAGTGFASNGTHVGAAPGAKLVNVKVLDSVGHGDESWLIEGINWVIANASEFNIKVVSMSLQFVYRDPYDEGTSEICLAADDAVANGLVVCAAEGNPEWQDFEESCYPDRIRIKSNLYCVRPPASPAAAFNVISVGGSEDKNTSTISDDTMWIQPAVIPTVPPHYYRLIHSRAGPTGDLRAKPDVVAPAANIISCNNDWENESDPYTPPYNGTSYATPLVAGAAALLLEQHPDWLPASVKEAFKSTAELNDDLATEYDDYTYGAENIRGKGIVNVTDAITYCQLTVETYRTDGPEITGVEVQLDDQEEYSPASFCVEEGTYNLTVEDEFSKGGDNYVFDHWLDGNESSSRTVNVTSDMIKKAYWRAYRIATRFLTSDQATVNGLTAYKLAENNSQGGHSYGSWDYGINRIYWGIRVWRRWWNTDHWTETEITGGSPVAVVCRFSGSGMQSATWACSQTNLSSTDSIVVRVYDKCGRSGDWTERVELTTEQLEVDHLRSSTWKVYYHTAVEILEEIPFKTLWGYRWGSDYYPSRIQNFQLGY